MLGLGIDIERIGTVSRSELVEEGELLTVQLIGSVSLDRLPVDMNTLHECLASGKREGPAARLWMRSAVEAGVLGLNTVV